MTTTRYNSSITSKFIYIDLYYERVFFHGICFASHYDKFYFKKYFTPLHLREWEGKKAVIKHEQYFIVFTAPFYCQYFLFAPPTTATMVKKRKQANKLFSLYYSFALVHYRCGIVPSVDASENNYTPPLCRHSMRIIYSAFVRLLIKISTKYMAKYHFT